MPIREYRCLKTNESFEVVEIVVKNPEQTIICKLHCDLDGTYSCLPHHAELQISSFNTTQIGKPSIVFRNPKTGEIQNASFEHQPVPAGFVKEELRNPAERTKFEKEYNQKMAQQDDIVTEMRRQKMDENQKSRQDKNKANLSKIAARSDNPSATKSLLRSAMTRNRKRERVPKKKTNVHFDVN
jgi:hypothetical protein